MKIFLGIDVGGTKCATVLARETQDGAPEILAKKSFPTLVGKPNETIAQIISSARETIAEAKVELSEIASIGVSCGGPLDSVRGVVMSPPNLQGWDNIEIVKILEAEFGAPAFLQNDANACALAEWLYGAGKGSRNMAFMTFGTGLGAGLILDGKLYAGTNDNAGEVGHMRLEKYGPVGYAKSGSFEGFCSGSGIAQLGKAMAMELLQSGKTCGFCKSLDELDSITAKSIAISADAGDPTAIEVYAISARHLGAGISIMIDILNPEKIVIGSIFARAENLLRPEMQKVIDREALANASRVCQVVPALLGESIGDIASVSVASNGLLQRGK